MRCAQEVAVIRQTMAALQVAGFHPVKVEDGEETTAARSADEVLTLALNVDECYVSFERYNETGWLRLVFGNDGFDVVCDYSARGQFADIVGSIEPERLAIPAACELHTWAWQNPERESTYGTLPESHGGCIKCGRHSGAGRVVQP
jgi:hypothetical protein